MLLSVIFVSLAWAVDPSPLEQLNIYDRCFSQIAKPYKFNGVEYGALFDSLDGEAIIGSGNNQLIVSGRKGTVVYSLEGNVVVKGVRCESSSEKKLGEVVAAKFEQLVKTAESPSEHGKRPLLLMEKQLDTALEKCSHAFAEVAAIRDGIKKRFRSAEKADRAESGR